MSETSDQIDNMDLDLPSSHQMAPTETQSVPNNILALDGSVSSIRSVSLILQAIIPILVSLVLLFAGRRLYRFTSTVSVALSSALFTWALFVNLETGQSIGNWTGEVAAVTVWSVMIGGSLIGSLLGYQMTWWGAHVTGRLCLGANSGLGFAFSLLLLKADLLIHRPAGQWSLVAVSAIMGIMIVLWDHVIGPLIAITLCGSFLFLLGSDLFNNLGLDGVAAGLRLLLDHNPDHTMYITSYTPPKSTIILIFVSWGIGFISFGLQYACYSVPFGPLHLAEDRDEEEGLNPEKRSHESIMEIKGGQTGKESTQSEPGSAATDPSASTSHDRVSHETSDGTKTSATLNDSNRPPAPKVPESSTLPYLSPRPGPGTGEYGSPPALALSPTVYSRYRRTQDPAHKLPSRTPILYNFSSHLSSFTNPRRVETVDEVTESSTSVRGGELTARSSILTSGRTSQVLGRTTSMDEEYINAMMHLASGEAKIRDNDVSETVGLPSVGSTPHQDNGRKFQTTDDAAQLPKSPDCQALNPPETCDQPKNQTESSVQQDESQVPIGPINSSPVPSIAASASTKVGTSSSSPGTIMDSSAFQSNQPTTEPTTVPSPTGPSNPTPDGSHGTSGQETPTSNHHERASSKDHTRSSGAQSSSQAQSESLSTMPSSSSSLPAVSHSGSRNADSDGDVNGSTSSGNLAAPHTKDTVNGSREGEATDLKRFSHRPLPSIPTQRPPSDDLSTGFGNKSDGALKMEKVLETQSLKSSTNSTGSSMMDNFLGVGQQSSAPTTPSSVVKTFKQELKEASSVYRSSRKRLSIVTGKQAQLPRTTSTRTQASQEAQVDTLSDSSPTLGKSTAVPHTPTLGNMLLRVSEGAEKVRRLPESTDPAAAFENYSNYFSTGEDGDDGDAATVRSQRSRTSTICMSSVFADHTSAEEGGQSSSGSDDGDDQSREQYFDPRRMKQLDKALGEWSNLFSDTEDGTEGSTTSGRKPSDTDERSPSLHSIPLPFRPTKPGSQDAVAQSSTSTTPVAPAAPFVGHPLAEVPWPQMRQPKTGSSAAAGMGSDEKRWTTASSIFPPLGYESSTSSPPSPQALKNADDASDSHASGTEPASVRVAKPRLSTGSLTSFESGVHPQKQEHTFCSASSHMAGASDYDTSDITSRIGDHTTDEEDPNYESAADLSKSFRLSRSLGATDGGYLTSEDTNIQSDF